MRRVTPALAFPLDPTVTKKYGRSNLSDLGTKMAPRISLLRNDKIKQIHSEWRIECLILVSRKTFMHFSEGKLMLIFNIVLTTSSHSGSPSPKGKIETFSLNLFSFFGLVAEHKRKTVTNKANASRRKEAGRGGGRNTEGLVQQSRESLPWIKRGHSKKHTFLSLPIASKHSAFTLTDVSPF